MPRYRNLQGSSDDLAWFGGCTKETPVWFYRVDTGQLELLRSDTRKSTLCFTNAVEKAAYIIPLNDVEEQVRLKRWEKDLLQANIDHVNDLWRELEWDIRGYFQSFD